jgi:hypothetical protein
VYHPDDGRRLVERRQRQKLGIDGRFTLHGVEFSRRFRAFEGQQDPIVCQQPK